MSKHLQVIILLLISTLLSPLSQAQESVLAPTAWESATLNATPEVATEIPTDATNARAFQVNARAMQFYIAQITMPATSNIAKDDTLYITFDARTTHVRDETGQGLLTVYFHQSGPPWAKSLLRPVALTADWTTYRFAFSAARDYSPTAVQGQLGFGFGGREQTVEIANVSVTNHGQGTAWRTAAAERIDKHRKADLSITIVDATGTPTPDAHVTVQQTKHAFLLGTAVSIAGINDPSPDGERYRKMIREWFNYAVTENALKWEAWIGQRDVSGQGTIEGALQWLNDQGIQVKGTTLIWPGYRMMPTAITALKDDHEALRTAVNQRVSKAAAQYRPYVDVWGVVNEPFDNHDLMDLFGDEIVAHWFNLAKAASPDTPLYINDYGILTGGDANNTPHRQHYEDTITELLEQEAPLEGIGIQSHFAEHLTPPEALIKVLDRFAQFNLPIQITEFDMDISDEALQADYTRDFMTAIFSHPQVNGFVTWGFWQGRHWRPKAAMFTKDWTPKPNAKAYHDLVYKTWWTDTHGATSDKGNFNTRAFLGDYEITVTHNGQTVTQPFVLSKANNTLTLTLP